MEVQILDKGYLRLVETWGSDQRIVEAARMSTDKGFLGWGTKTCDACPSVVFDIASERCPSCGDMNKFSGEKSGDEKLLKFLSDNRHDTPFEFAGMVIEVKAPIMVFREWHRHRTQCAHPDTLIHFDAPKSRENRRFVYKMRIEDIWKKWQPTTRSARPERQVNALWPRSRLQVMQLRNLDEEAREFGHSHIVDAIRGEPKEMVRVTTTSGRSVALTKAHRVLTSTGWMHLGDALKMGALLTLEGTRLVPTFEEIAEVQKLGMVPTYDLAVGGPWHNFVADGFVVHNSYNEMSARYTPLPDDNYVPTVERLMRNANGSNRQAGRADGATELTETLAMRYRSKLIKAYEDDQELYDTALQCGVPKELARLHLPVGRYSRMRASANLRNWLQFLTLRTAPNAQYEIRVYAEALQGILAFHFPKTMELFAGRAR